MGSAQVVLTGGVVPAYPNSVSPRLVVPAVPYAYAAGYDAIHSYEPVEQHGYKISYGF